MMSKHAHEEGALHPSQAVPVIRIRRVWKKGAWKMHNCQEAQNASGRPGECVLPRMMGGAPRHIVHVDLAMSGHGAQVQCLRLHLP